MQTPAAAPEPSPRLQIAEKGVREASVRAVPSGTCPGDPVCTPPSPHPLSWVPVLRPGPPYFLPPSCLACEMWVGRGFALAGCQGRARAQPRPGFPSPCFLQPHPGILPTSKGPCSRVTRAEVARSVLAAVTLISHVKSWPLPFSNFHLC